MVCALNRPVRRTSRQLTERRRVANIKSQIKRNKQNEKRHQRNKAVKSELKTLVRKFREAAASGDKDAAVEALRGVEKARQGRQQGRHPQEPGGQPQVGHGQAGRLALTRSARRRRTAVGVRRRRLPGTECASGMRSPGQALLKWPGSLDPGALPPRRIAPVGPVRGRKPGTGARSDASRGREGERDGRGHPAQGDLVGAAADRPGGRRHGDRRVLRIRRGAALGVDATTVATRHRHRVRCPIRPQTPRPLPPLPPLAGATDDRPPRRPSAGGRDRAGPGVPPAPHRARSARPGRRRGRRRRTSARPVPSPPPRADQAGAPSADRGRA